MARNLSGSTAQKREARDQKLQKSDWLVIRHRDQLELGFSPTLTQGQYELILAYRQALRDWDKVSALPAAPSFL
jgi:hypothetical protein